VKHSVLSLWAVGGFLGILEALTAQNPIHFFFINSDRSLYFWAFISYGIVFVVLALLFYPILRKLNSIFAKIFPAFMFLATLLIFLSILYAWIPAYRFLATKKNKANEMNFVLITLDTTRADHLGCYGYSKNTTPFLDSLAKKGILFENAYANATWTLPSHASLFTGMMPSVHGAGYSNFFVSPSVKTIAESLQEKGYTSAAFIGGPFLVSAFNLNQGFDFYDEHLDPHSELKRLTLFRLLSKITGKSLWHTDGQRRGAEINQEVSSYLRWVVNRQPFFLFINYFDAHEPYDPPQEIRDQMQIHTTMKGNIRFYPLNKRNGIACHSDGTPLSSDDFQQLRDLYDGELRYQDQQLEILWKMIEQSGIASKTILIIASDHGETIGEHQFLDHGHNLYQEQVHVPLLFYNSGLFSGGKRITETVQLIDVYPTMLQFVGLKPENGIQGHSLIPGLRSNQFPVRSVLSEIDIDSHPRFAAFKRSQKMILQDSLKYVDSSDKNNMLFDLQTDPAEMIDQQSNQPDRAEQLHKKLNELFRALEIMKHKGSGQLDEETREKLKSLGYIE
jgi:arylsulfatase A-like enzyme